MLTCGNWEWKKSYFKFESWWLEVEGFKEKVKEWWCSFVVEGRESGARIIEAIGSREKMTSSTKLHSWRVFRSKDP
ncbi:hypothetical protein H5410_057601 [Solanum commersonii]|uniref:Uncharacterized protein n=1 Tax=Solanum commersonii TaxID=4109 RepID=A0A9J5WNC2_SOLCO|nr:hypothetical protein H5410_057601 [Solanum commersonii]